MRASLLTRLKFPQSRNSKITIAFVASLLIAAWLFETPAGLLGKADAIGYAVCHRIDLRSFHLGSRTLPLCSRCTGTYLGVALAFVYFVFRKPRAALFPRKDLRWILVAISVLFVVDGINSFLHLFPITIGYTPNNTLRLITGMAFGIVIASIVFPGFNQTLWHNPQKRAALGSFRELGLLALGATLLIVAVESENPLLLYPLALISSASVLALLAITYTMILLTLFRRENFVRSVRDVPPYLAVGLILAVAQIAVFNLARFALFGTWGGILLST